MKTPIRHNPRSGISLIEVLVVLVLLLIGIFSVVRLFPGGFLVNKQSAEATYAQRLARQQLDFYTQLSANVMDAIVPIRLAAGGSQFEVATNVLPDDLSPGAPIAPGVDPYYYSGINKIRRILGETVRIPSPSPTSVGRGSVYMLSTGPVYFVPWSGQTESIFVYGAPMSCRVVDAQRFSVPDVDSPSQYWVDYDSFSFAFQPAPFPRQFLLTYSYYDANSQVQTIVDETMNVPANTNSWFTTTGNAGRPLAPDTDAVARKFRLLNTADLWSQQLGTAYDDPYEFKILSQNEGAFANVGVLVFNPFGYNHTEFTPSGPQPLTARIDYDVLDWHIIREDRPMQANGPYSVKLSLQGLKRVAKPARADLGAQAPDYEQDQTEYIGIFRDTSIAAAQRQDVLIYNVSTGDRVPEINPVLNQHNYRVNHKEGIVTFNSNVLDSTDPAIRGPLDPSGTYRFFYKAHGDWGMSVQKASHAYRRSATPNLGMSQFYMPLAAADPGDRTKMYFPLMDAGKTISIREYWYTDSSGTTHKVTNESFRIESNPTQFRNLNGQTLTWIDIRGKHSNAVGWDPVPVGQPAVGVQGVSFRSRVIWTSGGTVDESGAGSEARVRWRKIDLDSFLTRSNAN